MRDFRRVFLVTLVLVAFGIIVNVFSGPTAKVTDPKTKFHRLYVTGCPNNDQEKAAFDNDVNTLKTALEAAGNQADGSTSTKLEQPSFQELTDAIKALNMGAETDDEVTLYFTGHGGTTPDEDPDGDTDEPFEEHFSMNCGGKGDDGSLTDDQLDLLVTFFLFKDVSIVTMMDSCFGGGFTGGEDDLEEKGDLAVIGTKGTCPLGLKPGVVTLGEAIATGVSTGAADGNGDGAITADELKNWLGKDWELGPPNDAETARNPKKKKKGNSKCFLPGGGTCDLPNISLNASTAALGDSIEVEGHQFADEVDVHVKLMGSDLREMDLGSSTTDRTGSFLTTVTIPNVSSGEYWLFAVDEEENEHGLFIQVGSVGRVLDPEEDLVDWDTLNSAPHRLFPPPIGPNGEDPNLANDISSAGIQVTPDGQNILFYLETLGPGPFPAAPQFVSVIQYIFALCLPAEAGFADWPFSAPAFEVLDCQLNVLLIFQYDTSQMQWTLNQLFWEPDSNLPDGGQVQAVELPLNHMQIEGNRIGMNIPRSLLGLDEFREFSFMAIVLIDKLADIAIVDGGGR